MRSRLLMRGLPALTAAATVVFLVSSGQPGDQVAADVAGGPGYDNHRCSLSLKCCHSRDVTPGENVTAGLRVTYRRAHRRRPRAGKRKRCCFGMQ